MTLYERLVMHAALVTWGHGGPYAFHCHRHGERTGMNAPGCPHRGCASYRWRSPFAEMLPWLLTYVWRAVLWNEWRRQKTNASTQGNWRRFVEAQRAVRT